MNKRIILGWISSLAITAFSLQPSAHAAGPAPAAVVDFPSTVELAGQKLVLNGTGTRFKAFFQVYEAGLYASKPVHSADEFFSMRGAKKLHLVARRDINANELARMLVRSVSDSNPPDRVMQQLGGLAQVGEMFSSRPKIRNGETFGFDYLPNVGTQLMVNAKPIGPPIKDPEFFTLVMRLWLGATPVDARLKAQLLGEPPAAFDVARLQ